MENPKENYRLIIAPTFDNTFLPEHFIESMKDEYNPEYYRINVLGEFGNYSSGLVVKNFSSDNEKAIEYNKDLPLYLTCDFNVDPMCWCIAHKDDHNVYFFDELVIENTSTLVLKNLSEDILITEIKLLYAVTLRVISEMLKANL